MRVIAGVFLAALLAGCATGGGPKPPAPTPDPHEPRCSATLTCACWSGSGQTWDWLMCPPPGDPDPTPVVCETLESFKLARIGVRRIVDATPGHGFPACAATSGRPCRPSGDFVRLSPEGGSNECEVKAGPYKWSLDDVPCDGNGCNAGGNCFPNGGNPLQYVFCKPGVAKVVGDNGAASEITLP